MMQLDEFLLNFSEQNATNETELTSHANLRCSQELPQFVRTICMPENAISVSSSNKSF